MKKRLMILGGSRYLLPVIQTAKKLGIYVITCDYFPGNVAHKYSDEYIITSVMEQDKILGIAKEKKIDGIMSFACDPGVITAAFVAEKLGLPFQGSYKSTRILQDKGLFRQFLIENKFHAPRVKRYTDKNSIYADIDYFKWPVIVKPVDSAGSKGVTKVNDVGGLGEAVNIAISESHSGAFIVEEFLTFRGFHSSADYFTIDGNLVFSTYSDQLFDPEAENPYTPAYIIWPSSMESFHQKELTMEIQKLMSLLDMRTGIYNIETCVDTNGIPYIMEVSPRGGGCKIAEIQKLAFGVDLIEPEVRKAVGIPFDDIMGAQCDGQWCEMIVHAAPHQSGILKSIEFDSYIKEKYIKMIDISARPGDCIKTFTGANMALGDVFLRFDRRDEMDDVIGKSREWLRINLA